MLSVPYNVSMFLVPHDVGVLCVRCNVKIFLVPHDVGVLCDLYND